MQDTPVLWGGVDYANIYAAMVDKGERHVPIPLLLQLFKLSIIQLIDLLNEPSHSKRHIVTRLEEKFRQYEKSHSAAMSRFLQLKMP